MKRSYILIICLSIGLSCFSQSKKFTDGDYILDSIITNSMIHIIFDTTITIYKDAFTYNLNYDLKTKTKYYNTEYPVQINWLSLEETIYTYTDNYNLSSKLFRKRENQYTEMENDNLWTYQQVDDDYKSILSYWEAETWTPRLRITQNYDLSTFHKRYTKEYTNEVTQEWELYSRTDTILRSDGLLDTIKRFRWYDPLIMDTLFFSKYYYAFYPDTIISYTDSINGSIEKEYFDNEFDCYVNIKASVDSGIVKPYFKTHSTYDEDNNLVWYQRFESYGSTLQWDSAGHTQYIYNENSQLIEKIRIGFGSCERNIYEYNSDELLSKETYYQNMNIPEDYDIYEYFYSYKYSDIDEKMKKSVSNAYPNPSSNQFTISNKELIFDHYIILALNGKVIKSSNILSESLKVDVSDLPKGIYLLNLSGKSQNTNQKIVVN